MNADQRTYLHALLDAVPDGIMVLDEGGLLITVNRAAADLFGSRISTLPGRHIRDLFPADDIREWQWLVGFQNPSAYQPTASRTLIGQRHDGSHFQAEVRTRRFVWKGNAAILVMLRDVSAPAQTMPEQPSSGQSLSIENTAEAHMLRSLRESEEWLTFVLRANPAIVYALANPEPGAKVVYISPSVWDLLGYTPEEVMSTPGWWMNTLHPDDRDRAIQIAGTASKPATRTTFAYRLRKKAGGYVWLQDQVIVKIRDSGRPPVIGCLIDISERMRTEEELMRTREAALAASRVKSQFLANMSHEIRTPLHGILGIAELLLDTALSDEQKELISMLRTSGQTLLELIEDILDISKIEAGKLELNAVPFVPSEVIADALRLLALPAREKGIELTSDVAAGLSARVIGDPVRFRQVVLNLLANAVKFTPRGKVALTARVSAGSGIEVTVRDTGIGVPPDRAEAIFQAFTQSDGSTTRRFGGTGLGLTICRELVERMGGNIWYKSAEGGSIFGFYLYLPPSNDGDADDAGHASAAVHGSARWPSEVSDKSPNGLRVLLAEDNEVNAMLMQRLLTRSGYQVVHVASGCEAVAAWKREHFDVVLMDVQMPEMDGLEATRYIRKEEAQRGGHVPILALTANAMKEDEQICREAGMDGYLPKPIHPSRLFAELARITRSPPAGT